MQASELLAFSAASELAERIRRKELSPVEVVDTLLQRIGDIDPQLNAYLTVAESEARSSARKAEAAVMQGGKLPPLHGVPFSIKDFHYLCQDAPFCERG